MYFFLFPPEDDFIRFSDILTIDSMNLIILVYHEFTLDIIPLYVFTISGP